jgi:sialate O-acetylesterase
MKKILMFLAVISFTQNVTALEKYLEVPAIFSDNMVLQQKSKVLFWGKAMPDEQVIIKASYGQTANTIVQKDSSWIVKLKTPKAGGPYEINLQVGDSIIVFKNVLVGEVWLCSGQSNMEMPLNGFPPRDTIAGASEEIKNAANSNIRFFTVVRAYSNQPEFNCNGTWVESSPEAAARFSATAYFFGKKLYKELKVPIGLINSSWGGTRIESWISKKYLNELDEFKATLKKLELSSIEIKGYREWLKNHPIINVSAKDILHKWEGLDFSDSVCALQNYNDSNWVEMKLPTLWEATEVGNFDGTVWFRKKVEIPANWLNKDLVLELGPIDDMDITFVNGKKVGGYETEGYWQTDRVYNIPKEIVNDTLITIAVRVVDHQGGGGIWGKKEKMKIHPKEMVGGNDIPIYGVWKYLPVAQYLAGNFYVFGEKGEEYFKKPLLSLSLSDATPTSLYNGMMAPLVQFSVKGIIWYQGESNTGNPDAYKTLFPLMIKNWREVWKQGNSPFYYVQIAPYEYGENTKSERLREAQLLSLSVPNTGMAVTMDIGNPTNIHPPDKKDVGERLALWALAKDYHKKVFYSGPIYKSMKVIKDKIILSFDYADGGLVIKEKNAETNFLIAGDDKIFKKANVKIKGNKLIIDNPEILKPQAVRYAWSNTAEATLFNKKGLPASSFRTDNWDN